MMRILVVEKRVKLQYLQTVHPETLAPLKTVAPGSVLALAAFVDGVRLIDNQVL
jgi:pantothenate synthetase